LECAALKAAARLAAAKNAYYKLLAKQKVRVGTCGPLFSLVSVSDSQELLGTEHLDKSRFNVLEK
jgi:hypothetical protein